MRLTSTVVTLALLLLGGVGGVGCADAESGLGGTTDTPDTNRDMTTGGDPPVPTEGELSTASVLFIGHSLIGWNMPSMLGSIAADGGKTHAFESQIGNGGTIQLQWVRPAEGVNAREVLATGRHDVVITTEAIPLQSNYQWSGTVEFAGNFYDLLQEHRPGARFYLYETWHSRDEPNWRERIDTDRALWETIIDEINAAHEGPDVLMIPGGTALGRLVDRIEAGNVPGVTSVDALFEDDIHMSDLGWYFIACVQYETIYRTSPVGRTGATTNRFGSPFPAVAAETARVFQEVAWDVVSRDARSGVASR